MSLAPLQQYHANHPFTADIFGPYPPGAVEFVRFWSLGLANLTRGPPNNPSGTPSQDASQVNLRAHNEAYARARAPTTFTQEV
jgi:hypothetical protein